MIRNKTTLAATTLLFVAALGFRGRAQTVPEALKVFPASVINQVYQISSTTTITVQKQLAFAQYFLKQDKLANAALKNGGSAESVAHFYAIDPAYLKSVLSDLEFNDYYYATRKIQGQVAAALKYRTQIALSKTQINSLLAATNTAGAKNAGNMVSKILTDQQYNDLLQLYVKPSATESNDDSWAQLKALGFVDEHDPGQQYTADLNYYILAAVKDAKAINGGKYFRIDSVRGEYVAFKPYPLLKLDMANNELPESQFAAVLRIRDQLKLNGQQIDSLIAGVRGVENAKQAFKQKQPSKKFDPTLFETTHLSGVLNHQQYDSYLIIKNKDRAIVNEKKTWDRLKQYGLTQNIDSIKVGAELMDYELNKLVSVERFHVDDSPQNAELRKKAENDKPLILKKLDITVKTTVLAADPKKTLAW